MRYIVFLVIVICSYGCATIFNGKSQHVPVVVPEGTTIFDTEGASYPIYQLAWRGDTSTYIRLLRKNEYTLRFTYRDIDVVTSAPRKFDFGWLANDFFFWPVIIVDIVTGAWHSFDGMKLDFPPDSFDADFQPIVEVFEPTEAQLMRIGGSLMIGLGRVFPSDIAFIFPNAFFGGVGYAVSPDIDIELSAASYGANAILPANTRYFDVLTNVSTFHLSALYPLYDRISIGIGGGLTSFGINGFSTRSATEQVEIDTIGFSKQIGTAAAGIRYTFDQWFIEFKHTFGLSMISFPNGERAGLQASCINFGFIAHF